jgi:Domain of unknown function (DUF4440)
MSILTRITCCTFIALLSQLFLLQQAQAQEEDAAALVAIVHAVAKGWEQADGTPFREHFLDFEGARYIESGGQNAGLDDLVEHHVEPEGDALDSLELTFSDIETHIEGDFAWAIANTEVKAVVKRDQREIHNRGHETFLFRRVGGVWKVVHTHSSSRPVVSETSHEQSDAHD